MADPFAYLFGSALPGQLPKRRGELDIFMDILGSLLDGPARPTHLAAACNLNYENLMEHARILIEVGYIHVSAEEDHELYAISPEGMQKHREYRDLSDTLYPKLGIKD